MTYGVRSSVLARSDRLPSSRAALKVAEGLGKLKGLNDDALLLFVVTELSVTSQGEILAQGMSIETIVGHDTAQIGVTGEENTEHIIHLTLVPQGTLEKTSDTGDGGGLVTVGLDTDAGVESDTEQVVDDLETLITGGEVDTSNVGNLGELSSSVVLQEAHEGKDTRGSSVNGKLILPDSELLDVFGQARHDVLSIGVQAVGLVLVLVGRVDTRSTEGSLG